MAVIQALLLFLLFQLSSASTEFSITKSSVSCSGALQVDSLSLACSGGYCTFGSDVIVEGSVTIKSDLGTDRPTVKVTLANVAQIVNKEIDLCGKLTSSSGSTCPSAGSYTLDSFRFTIPGSGDQWYSQSGYWGSSIALKASFDFGTSTGYCSTAVTLKKNSGYQMAYGALLMMGIGGIVAGIGRRRKVATIQLSEGEGTTSHFEMMPNEASCKV